MYPFLQPVPASGGNRDLRHTFVRAPSLLLSSVPPGSHNFTHHINKRSGSAFRFVFFFFDDTTVLFSQRRSSMRPHPFVVAYVCKV
jgi:hypothetical protein